MICLVLRERYLRDDVACGIHSCSLCASQDAVLSSSGSLDHPSFPAGHFVLPDTNVFLSQVSLPHFTFNTGISTLRHPWVTGLLLWFSLLPDNSHVSVQMDLMESAKFSPPMILLQTVMEEVRHRSLPLYSRLKALVKADDKNIWVFYNEYRS